MTHCNTVPHFGVTALPTLENSCPNAIYFVKQFDIITMYVTDQNGVPFMVGFGSPESDIVVTSPDNSIAVNTQGENVQIQISEALQEAINNSIQEGDNISLLVNDANYITLADIGKDLPEDFFVSVATGTSNITYKTDSYRTITLQELTNYTITSGVAVLREKNDLIFLEQNTSVTNQFNHILVRLHNCYISDNILKWEYVTDGIFSTNGTPSTIIRVHDIKLKNGFLYLLTRVPLSLQNTTTSRIYKINANDFSDVRFYDFPLEDDYIGGAAVIEVYKNKLYIQVTQDKGGTNLIPKLISLDSDLTNPKVILSIDEVTKRAPNYSGQTFIIYHDEVYIVHCDRTSNYNAFRYFGISVYDLQGVLKRDTIRIDLGEGNTQIFSQHWMTIFGDKIIITPSALNAANGNRVLVRVDSKTLELEEKLQLGFSPTNDNSLFSDGYIYINSEGTTPVGDLLKVKYNDFTDTTVELTNYRSTGSINPIVEKESLNNLKSGGSSTIPVSKGLISGDSTIASYLGQNAVASYIISDADDLAGTTITDISVPGHTIANQKTDWQTVPNKNTFDYVIVQVGLNDLGNTSVSNLISQYQDYINTIRSSVKSSCKIIVGSMIPCKRRLDEVFPGAGYQNWLDLNQAIMGGGSTPITGVDYRVDSHYYALKDAQDNLADVFDLGDFIHENNYGRNLIAQGYRLTLKELNFIPQSSTNQITGDLVHTFGKESILGVKTLKNGLNIEASDDERIKIIIKPGSQYGVLDFVNGSGNAGSFLIGKFSDTYGPPNEGLLYNLNQRIRFGTGSNISQFILNLDGNSIFSGTVTIAGATIAEHAVQLQQIYTRTESLGLFVGLNGVQTITDTKTFSSSPVIPNATLISHAVNLGQIQTIFSTPVSSSQSGIVDNTLLQELGGTDKLINGIRIGIGNNNIGYNQAFGAEALNAITTGDFNLGLGSFALSTTTSGEKNTGVGTFALYLNSTGNRNTAVGAYSMFGGGSGSSNTAVGQQSLQRITSGNRNTGMGDNALANALVSSDNTVFGNFAGNAITSGERNVIIGSSGGSSGGITTGSNNLIIAPNNGIITGVTGGSGNVIIGKVTGLLGGSTNTVIFADGVGNKVLEAVASDVNGVLLKGKYAVTSINGNFADVTGNIVVPSGGTIDPTPTSGSANAVSSGGVFTALALKANDTDVVHKNIDETITSSKVISTTGSTYPLVLQNSAEFMGQFQLKNTGAGSSRYAAIDFFGGSGIGDSQKFQFGQYSNGTAFFYNSASQPIDFYTSGAKRLTIEADGRITALGTITASNATAPSHLVTKSQLDAVSNATKIGTSTQSGNGILTSFNIPHGLGITPIYYNAVATSAAAGNISYVTADATNIIVNYVVAPASGTNNLSWNWITK